MYAVIETGGKQYRVEVGTELEVELLDAEPGKTITIDRVLLVADGDDSTIGRPLVADASVSAEIVTQTRGTEAHLLQVPPEGPEPGQEGSPPGADPPSRRRHHARWQERREVGQEGRGAGQDRAPAHRGGRHRAGRQGRRARRQAGGRVRGAGTGQEGDQGQGQGRDERRRRPRPNRPRTTRRPRPSRRRRRPPRPTRQPKPRRRPRARPRPPPTRRPRPRAAAPKKSTAKAAADAPDADADAAPKRTRTTKKDE